jgi:hypothetical protein
MSKTPKSEIKSIIVDNAKRALRLEIALLALHDYYGDDPFAGVVDILTDAMHLCDAKSYDFGFALALAGAQYVAELNDDGTEKRRLP